MSLKSFIGNMRLNSRKKKVETHPLEFPTSLGKVQKILVCLPGGLRELTLMKQFLPTIRDIFKPAAITLMSTPGAVITDIYPRQGFQILSPTLDQTTWTGLPRQGYIKVLQDYKFDLVLDLNLEPTLFTSGVLLSFPKAVRVGRGNHLGEPFYNLEIKTKYLRDERNIYKSLLGILGGMRQTAIAMPSRN